MFRSITRPANLIAAALLATPGFVRAQADTRPVIVVFTFTNSSIGGARSDYDGLSTGVQDLLITDLASNTKFRLVDRSRIAELLQEQNLIKTGQIDPQTAVRLGKILGAQYAITGNFMADKAGGMVMTSHSIDIETSQIANPEKITGKADDVLGMIAQLSSKVSNNTNLAPKRSGSSGSAGGSTGGETGTKTATTGTKTASSTGGTSSKPAGSETYAKQLPTPVVEKTMKAKLDAATMKLYSRGLEEMDAKNNAKAADLFRQVKAKFPDFEPAQRYLDQLGAKASN